MMVSFHTNLTRRRALCSRDSHSMTQSSSKRSPRPIQILFEYSGFLLIGTIVALIWANVDQSSYNSFVHHMIMGGEEHHESEEAQEHTDEHESHDDEHDDSHETDDQSENSFLGKIYTRIIERPDQDGHKHGITIHFLINDVLMALFFAIAAKEVLESLLPGGALSNFRKAATPLMATLGGIVGPAGIYIAGAVMLGQSGWFGQEGNMARGWAIPCATDIAFSYLFARLIFGSGHPAIAFLLLLAIADDAAGLIILAVAYPSKDIQFGWFVLTLISIGIAYVFQRKLRLHSFWWYLLIPGVLCWLSFDLIGIHPALGLVPIVFFGFPHAHTDLGIFAKEELKRHDTLNEFEHWWKNPVELVLGMFGLANAGVVFSTIGSGTTLVLMGLLIGKPVGITLFTWFSEKVLKLEVPAGMTYRHIVSLGMVAAIGFTVALFVSTAAFPATNAELRPYLDPAKMGALLSFSAAIIAYIVARSIGVRPEPVE